MSQGGLCIFGEVLFDHFPDGSRVLGGAPFNVAWHLQAFSQSPRLISRVGADAEGEAILAAMSDWGMETAGMQRDPDRPTGRVSVSFDNGEPVYDIVTHCAYDAIEPTDTRCGFLYHGSLALREQTSSQSVERIVAGGPDLVFVDVNLRPPWWQRERVLERVRAAHWVKLNADELTLLAPGAEDPQRAAREFVRSHELSGLILTRGAQGAALLTAAGDRLEVRPQTDIEVIDTVGAGDAFASVVILGLRNGWALDTTLARAQDFASRLVGNRGATVGDPAFYRSFIDTWQP